MVNIGVKISDVGQDVLNTSDQNLGFSSAFDQFKISAQGRGIVTLAASGSETVTINHGLGYAPLFVAWGTTKSGIYYFGDTGGILVEGGTSITKIRLSEMWATDVAVKLFFVNSDTVNIQSSYYYYAIFHQLGGD